MALLFATNAADKAIPWFLARAIDGLRAQRGQAVVHAAEVVLALAAVMWLVRSLSRVVLLNVGRDVEYDLRKELLAKIHALGSCFTQQLATGEIMSRATNDLNQVRLLSGFGVMNSVNSVVAYVSALSLMFALSPTLTLYALIPYPFFALLTRSFAKRLYHRSRAAQEALGGLADRAQENIAAVRVVRSLGLEEHEERRFEEANQRAIEANMKLTIIRGAMWPVLMLLGSTGTLVVVWIGGQMVLAGELSVGQLAAFLAYLGQLLWPTMALGFLLSVVQRGRASYARVREILDAEESIVEQPDPIEPSGEGALCLRGLSFSYGEHQVLQEIDLELKAGASLAIVGRVASGKSTLAALMPRLLPVPDGAIFVDGVDVNRLRLRSLRREVAYAAQDPFLFSTTIYGNIAFALDEPYGPGARKRVRAAAEEAVILEEVDALPEGFDTLVGERGVQLSGGQKQRVALARALLNSPAVLVLDDPMSAVDARTESKILSAIDRAARGRTLVLITHRVVAAARAEQILVLDAGRVVERGSHEELLAADGLYASMARQQALRAELAELDE
ncbi:MAG: ABC transporter ATP-binding protein [Deltaproteobacteria bacterium]|nr:ABC transporter ATP-binding protein [Deltaproteobacteria bacterium]